MVLSMFNTKSFRNLFLATVFTAPLFTACGGMEGEDGFGPESEASSDEITVSQTGTGPIGQINTCLTQAPDATMTAGPDANGHYFGHRASGDTAFTSGGCASYVVDVVVPGTYGVEIYGTMRRSINISARQDGASLTQINCDNASERVRIYKKSHSILTGSTTSLSSVNNQNVTSGTWVPFIDMGVSPFCQLSHPFKVTAAGHPFTTDTYRVLIDGELYNNEQAARVSWTWVY